MKDSVKRTDGCVYGGFNWRRSKIGSFKIGESEYSTPAKRLTKLRNDEPAFEMLHYIVIYNLTQNQRRLIEAEIRVALEENCPELVPYGNDHFYYPTEKGLARAHAEYYIGIEMQAAINCCNKRGWKHSEIKNAHYKRK